MTSLRTLLVLLCVWLLAACSANGACYSADTGEGSMRSIYVVRRAWHTGIAVARAEWPDRAWPLLADFPAADYLEFGWGDERFYQAEGNPPGLATRAVLWPTSSVVHVIGLKAPLPQQAMADELVEVRISAAGLQALADSIQRTFAEGRIVATSELRGGAPGPDRFYRATGKFYFPRMCNWWSMKQLAAAGCPVRPGTIITASSAMQAARGLRSHDDATRESVRQ